MTDAGNSFFSARNVNSIWPLAHATRVLHAWLLILGMVAGGAALGTLYTWNRAGGIIAELRAD
jgi:hypothetical protein